MVECNYFVYTNLGAPGPEKAESINMPLLPFFFERAIRGLGIAACLRWSGLEQGHIVDFSRVWGPIGQRQKLI